MSDEKRRYRMTRRAEREEETRLRITESAVALHGTVGPAHTSISALAKHAGVTRSTVYRHFPDETAILAACSAHWLAANPFPDPAAWATVADPDARLETALADLYGYYRRTEGMMTNVLRDEETVPALRRLMDGYRQYLAHAREVLMQGRRSGKPALARLRAAIGHALALATWRSLAIEQGLGDDDCVALMCAMVRASAAPSRSAPTASLERAQPHRR